MIKKILSTSYDVSLDEIKKMIGTDGNITSVRGWLEPERSSPMFNKLVKVVISVKEENAT